MAYGKKSVESSQTTRRKKVVGGATAVGAAGAAAGAGYFYYKQMKEQNVFIQTEEPTFSLEVDELALIAAAKILTNERACKMRHGALLRVAASFCINGNKWSPREHIEELSGISKPDDWHFGLMLLRKHTIAATWRRSQGRERGSDVHQGLPVLFGAAQDARFGALQQQIQVLTETNGSS